MKRDTARATDLDRPIVRSTDGPSPVGASTRRFAPPKPRGKPAEHDHAQRNAVHDVRPLVAHDAHNAEEAAQRLERAEAAPLVLQRHDAAAFRLDARRMVAHARRHHDLETGRARGAGHRQEMGDEKPVLGDEIKKFGHQHSADRRDGPL